MIKRVFFLYEQNFLVFSTLFLTLLASYLAEDHSHSVQNEFIRLQLIPSENNHDIQRRMINNDTTNLADNNYAYKSDTHKYYNSTFITSPDIAKKYWVDLNNEKTVTNDLLSNSYRRATTIQLNFDFPFYGYIIRNVTITTGGFIFTGDYIHSQLASMQYIAPLMANFNPSLSKNSYVKFLDNGTSFTVQWENVRLDDYPYNENFTFQTTLHKNGDIVFTYLSIPEMINWIQDDNHPIKIGLSDAYIIDMNDSCKKNLKNEIFGILYKDYALDFKRKVINEYHKVSFAKENINNSTVIYLTALPTCLEKQNCFSCLKDKDTAFKCAWCPATSRCSNIDGVNRFHQEWLLHQCETKQILNATNCKSLNTINPDSREDVIF